MPPSVLALATAALLALPACAPSTAAPVVAPEPERAPDAIDALVARSMASMHIPGLTVAVVRAGKIEKLAAYGLANLEWQVPVTLDTRFQIASTTKLFTGTLLMLLVQEGKLSLTDPVSRHLPEAPAAWRDITVGHLAAHTSGIQDVFDPELATVEDAYNVIRDKPLTFASGARDWYPNGDFIVLSLILERVSGMKFPEHLRTKLIEPLQLTCTGFEDATLEAETTRTAQVVPHRASVYRWQTDRQRLHWFLYPPYTYAMGGAFSCIGDLVKWAVAMDRGTLLSAASQRVAATPFRLTDGKEAGFSAAFSVGMLRGRRRMGHSGGPALGDVVRIPDDKLTVIVLANQQRMLPALAPAIASLELPDTADQELPDEHTDWTRRLRAIADDLPAGRVDTARLSPAVRDKLATTIREWGPIIAGAWAAIDRWSLVSESSTGENRTRIYRARHGALVVRWVFTVDADGLLVDFEADPD